MKFRQYLKEIEDESGYDLPTALSDIQKRVAELEPEELIDFGEWLEDEMGDEYDEEEFGELNDYNSIIAVINEFDADDLQYILYMMDDDDDDDIDVAGIDSDDDDIDESVSIKFKAKNRNRKKTKRFTLNKAQFRAQKANRKKANRENRADRKKNYRKNKVKLKKYDKSYNAAVKSGKHFKKIRR